MSIIILDHLSLFFAPSENLLLALLTILSDIQRKSAPQTKPRVGIIYTGRDEAAERSIAGCSRDQKLAAIITPAANPSIVFKTFRLTFLKKKTVEAPSAVTNHVKSVAKRAISAGLTL